MRRDKQGCPTSKQVLILNVTRMGDLVQTSPLVSRLKWEWPDVAVDLMADQRFASTASLIPGVRQLLTFDFHGFLHKNLPMTHTLEDLSPGLSKWLEPLKALGYDRVINLTFTPRSGLLAAALGIPDTRGAVATPGGTVALRNPWLTHFVNLRQDRHLNHFNLVDLYSLGGSGPGPFAPIRLSIPRQDDDWACQFLSHQVEKETLAVAVQVGASQAKKAWRPEYFGLTMAAISFQAKVTFILIGMGNEAGSVELAVKAYRSAGGKALLLNAMGQTGVSELAGLLKHCRLLLTNDTGPMHLAVGVGTPVVDLSLGHVHFRETGPFGPGHWVIEPRIDCAPCVYEETCLHHACKDQVVCEQVAELAVHCLGKGPFPTGWTDVGVYESGVDEDGLACFRFRAGSRDSVTEWYGTFWRRFWYETWTGLASGVPHQDAVPDLVGQQEVFERLDQSGSRAVTLSMQLVNMSRQQAFDTVAIKDTNADLLKERQRIFTIARATPAFRPLAVGLAQDLYDNAEGFLTQRLDYQAKAYAVWGERNREVMRRLQGSTLA